MLKTERMRVLVTGAAGFIGSHVADALIANGHEVIAMDDLSGGFLENVPTKAVWIHGSVCETGLVRDVMMNHRPDYVIHAAAYAAEGLSHHIRRFNYQNNLMGSVNLINAAVKGGVKCFVFLSSIAVYGHGNEEKAERLKGERLKETARTEVHAPVFTEEMAAAPCDPYGVAKLAVEMDLRAAHDYFGLPFVIFRPHNVFGPRQNMGDPYRNVIGIFMNQCLKGEPMPVFGDGKQSRAFSYITDVAPAIAASVDRPGCWGGTFNIGGGLVSTVNEIALDVAQAMGALPSLQYLPGRNEVMHAACSHEAARVHFGDLMRGTPLHTGLKEMAAWAKRQGTQRGEMFTGIEIEDRLPVAWRKLTY